MYAYASRTRGPHVVLEVLTHMYIYPAVDAEIYQVHSCILTGHALSLLALGEYTLQTSSVPASLIHIIAKRPNLSRTKRHGVNA